MLDGLQAARLTVPAPCCGSWAAARCLPGGHDQRRLSGREEEVARLVAQGLSNAEVGERLFISSRTVSTHLQHIYRRLELPSRAALIRYVLDGCRHLKLRRQAARIRRPTDGTALRSRGP